MTSMSGFPIRAPAAARLTRAEFDEKWTGYAALFDYTTEFEKTRRPSSGSAWLVPFFQPRQGPPCPGHGAGADRERAAKW